MFMSDAAAHILIFNINTFWAVLVCSFPSFLFWGGEGGGLTKSSLLSCDYYTVKCVFSASKSVTGIFSPGVTKDPTTDMENLQKWIASKN